jgi:ABC-type glycerol-3-phosphate transport system permease component
MKKRISFSDIIIASVLVLLGLTTIYPFYYILIVSLSTYREILNKSLLLYPVKMTLGNDLK